MSIRRLFLSPSKFLVAAVLICHPGIAQERFMTNILIRTDAGELHAQLEDSPAARAFSALLPLSLELTDYANTEKVADLPAKLPTEGSPPGAKPVTGDLTYYAPWGNLAIFYKDFGYAAGLIRLGHIDGDISLLTPGKPVRVLIAANSE